MPPPKQGDPTMRVRILLLVLILPLLGVSLVTMVFGEGNQPRFARRWFYASFNLATDKNADELVALIRRAAKAGYNGLVLADYKFNKLGEMPASYFRNVERVQKAAAEAGIEIIPTVCPIGYSSGLLGHDVN